MITTQETQRQTSTVMSAADVVRALFKFPPHSPFGEYRTIEKQNEALLNLKHERDAYCELSRQYISDHPDTNGDYDSSMAYLDTLIAKHLAGYGDMQFGRIEPDYGSNDFAVGLGRAFNRTMRCRRHQTDDEHELCWWMSALTDNCIDCQAGKSFIS